MSAMELGRRSVRVHPQMPLAHVHTAGTTLLAFHVLLRSCDDLSLPTERLEVLSCIDAGSLEPFFALVSPDSCQCLRWALELARTDPPAYHAWRGKVSLTRRAASDRQMQAPRPPRPSPSARSSLSPLSPRRRQVLTLYRDGVGCTEIGEILGLSRSTVAATLRDTMRYFGFTSVTSLRLPSLEVL